MTLLDSILRKAKMLHFGPIARAGFMVLILLGAALISLLWWRADANLCACEYCPDAYCVLAEKFIAVLTHRDGASLEALRQFAQGYMHAHNPLGPVLQAMLSLVIPHPLVSYMIVSGAATLVTWVCLRKITDAIWHIPPAVRALIGAAFFTHVLVVRAFVRPITDALGMLATIGALYALGRYLETRTAKASLLLAGAQFIGLFSRVSFIPVLGMPVLAELVGTGRFTVRMRRAWVAGLFHGLIPGLLYLGFNVTWGTAGTLGQAWEAAHQEIFTHFYTAANLLTSTLMSVQLYVPLALAFGTRALWTNLTCRLHLAWIGLYLAFLGLGGGALWPRYFLPIVPSVFVLTAPVLERVHQTRPWHVRVLMVVLIIGNLLYPLKNADLGTAGRLLVNEVQAMIRGTMSSTELQRLLPSGWKGSAREGQDGMLLAFDGQLVTKWSTGRPQTPGMFFQIDLGKLHPIAGLSLWATALEHPRRYAVDISEDGKEWLRVAGGRARREVIGFLEETQSLFVRFPASPARYARISLIEGDPSSVWSIHEIAVYRTRASLTTAKDSSGQRIHLMWPKAGSVISEGRTHHFTWTVFDGATGYLLEFAPDPPGFSDPNAPTVEFPGQTIPVKPGAFSQAKGVVEFPVFVPVGVIPRGASVGWRVFPLDEAGQILPGATASDAFQVRVEALRR